MVSFISNAYYMLGTIAHIHCLLCLCQSYEVSVIIPAFREKVVCSGQVMMEPGCKPMLICLQITCNTATTEEEFQKYAWVHVCALTGKGRKTVLVKSVSVIAAFVSAVLSNLW